MDDDIYHWLVLAHAPGLGVKTYQSILDHWQSPGTFLDALGDSDIAAQGFSGKTLQALKFPDLAVLEKDIAWLDEKDNHIIVLSDPRYPPLLREIPDPPPLLYVTGDADCMSLYQLSIVGSRNPSVGGRATAEEFAAELARRGFVITSGLALGIDAASHRGALSVGARTIAVMGTGPDRIYPARNKNLAHEIVDGGGALVTEFPPGSPPLADHFPRRNRIVSGLGLGTLVVEAAMQSGSLITARLAAEQGREVFAIPGSIHNPLAKGCHRLIRLGAKLVESVEDILEELQIIPIEAATEKKPHFSAENTEILAPEYRHLLDNIGYDPISVDVLIERCGLTPETVSSMLLILELRGYISSAVGGCIIKTTKESVL